MSRDADLTLRGRIDWTDVFESMDALEGRVDRLKAKVREVGRETTKAGPSQNELEGAKLARAAAQAREAEAKADKAALDVRTRQEREAARQTIEITRDVEREKKRSEAEQAKAFKARIDAENRQRKEAAAIARELERDEERDLKAFGDRQRREYQALLEERKRVYQQEAAAAEKRSRTIAAQEAAVWRAVAGALTIAVGAAVAFAAAVAKISFDAFKQFVSDGIAFNQQIETAKLNIAAMVGSFYEIRDASGGTVEGVGRLNAGLEISSKLVRELQIGALETNATTAELVEIYKGALSGYAKAKIPLQETVGLTIRLTQAAQAVGIENGRIGQQINQLVTGNIRINTQLAKRLDISKAEIENWTKQGTLVENLNAKLEIFNAAGAENQKTFAGLASNLEDSEQILAGMATSQIFDKLKEAAGVILPALFDLKKYEVQPQIKAIVDFVDSSLGRVGDLIVDGARTIVDYVQRIGDFVAQNRPTLDDIVDRLVEVVRQAGNLLTTLISTLEQLHFATNSTKGWGQELQIVGAFLRGLGLELAAIADFLDAAGKLALKFKAAVVAGMLDPLGRVLELAAQLLDVFSNIGRAISSWAPGIASAAGALASGNFVAAVTALSGLQLPSSADLTAPTAAGDRVRQYAASAREAGRSARFEALSGVDYSHYTRDYLDRLNHPDLRAAGRATNTYTTNPGAGGGGDAGKADADARKLAAAAQKFEEQLQKIRNDVAELRASLPLTVGQFDQLSEAFRGADPNNATEFLYSASKVAAIFSDPAFGRAPSLLSEARQEFEKTRQEIEKFQKGQTVQLKGGGFAVVRPDDKQIAEYTAKAYEKLSLQYGGLLAKSAVVARDIREQIDGMNAQLETGARSVDAEYQKMLARISDTKDKIEHDTLVKPEDAARLKQDFEDASKALFNEEQEKRAKDFWTRIAAKRADLETDARARELASIQAEQLAFEADVRNKIKDETEADKIIAAHREALQEKYWQDERIYANQLANERRELEIGLITSTAERIKALRQLTALRAAQAIDPNFDPNAAPTGTEANRRAAEEYKRTDDIERLKQLVALTAQLRENLDFAGTALGKGLDTGRIQALAERVRALGLDFQDVGRAIGFSATNLLSFSLQVSALEKLQAGNILGGLVDSFKAATAEVLLSTQTFTQLGQALGNALLGNAGSIKEFGKYVLTSILSLIGQIAINLGTMLILVGTGLSTVPFLFGLSGGAAIAAGAALVAFGIAVTAASTAIQGAGQSSSASAAATAGGGTSNVTSIDEGRRRRQIRGGDFNTSGESTERRPIGFFGPRGSGRDDLVLDINLDVAVDKDAAVQHFVTKLNRGSVKKQVKRKLAS